MSEPAPRRPGGRMASRPLHFIWLADGSGSMRVEGKIQALNHAIREAIPHMRSAAQENPHATVFVNAIRFADEARWLDDRPLLAEAEQAVDFLHANVWTDGRLYACHAGGRARFPAYLDDHAFLLDALLALLQVRWNGRDLDWAIALADALLERFEDQGTGGFFFTAHDAEALPQRPKPWMDDSLPSGNGVAARALLKLGHLLGEPRYLDAAERTLRAAWRTLVDLPHACCSLLLALDEFLQPTAHLVVRHGASVDIDAWADASVAHRRAGVDVYFIPSDAARLPGVLAAPTDRDIVAYLCRGTTCGPPIVDKGDLIALHSPT